MRSVRYFKIYTFIIWTLFTSNSIVEGLLGQMACLIRRVQDLIIEDGEVERKTQSDGVCWRKISLRNFGSILISLKRLVGGFLALLANCKFSEISVVVSLPIRRKNNQFCSYAI